MTDFAESRSSLRAIVLIHYGDVDSLLENCRQWELKAAPEIVLCILDNGPGRSGLTISKSVSPNRDRWKIIESPKNLGYMGGAEEAIRSMVESGLKFQDSDFVIISNSDVENLSDPSTLLSIVGDDPAIAVVGPTIIPTPTWAPHDLPLARSTLGAVGWGMRSLLPKKYLASLIHRARSSTSESVKALPLPPNQTMVHGACFGARFDVLLEYLALPRRPWMYGEEVLIGRILSRMGLVFAIDGSWSVNHPPKEFPEEESRRLARARSRALWTLSVDRIAECFRRRRLSHLRPSSRLGEKMT